MKRVDYRTDNVFDGGRIQIRDRSLRLTFPQIASGFATSQDIDPDECCSEAPGDHLLDAAADLLAFFDKWYGSGGRSEVDGFYIWSNANCPPPAGLRVPTATHLDDVSQFEELCADPPPLHDAFNTMRDAVVHMASLVRKRPGASSGGIACPIVVSCESPKMFNVRFSSIRNCVKPFPCEFAPSSGAVGNPDSRAKPGEKLCTHHYIELEDIIDEIMTDGVVFINYGDGVLVKSGTVCGAPFVDDKECVEQDLTTYVPSTTTSCCSKGECCFSPTATLTGFVGKILEGTYMADTDDPCCLPDCFFCDTDCPASPFVDADISKWLGANLATYTQNGVATFNFIPDGECSICSWDVPCNRALRNVNMDVCTQEPRCEFTDDTANTNVELTVTRLSNGSWSIDVFETDFVSGCLGVSEQTGVERCEVIGRTVLVSRGEWADFDVDPDNAGCGANCACQECPCPGDVDSVVTSESRPTIGSTKPTTRYNIVNKCGDGHKQELDVSVFIKYERDCPDSSLTNIVMLDPRINAINDSTFTDTTLEAPALAHPGCPAVAIRTCAGFECLKGYGELA